MMKLSDQDALLLNAYLDGEMAALEAVDFERRLAGEPGLSAELGTYRAMRSALRADRSDDVPSADLGRRIMANLNLRQPTSHEQRRQRYAPADWQRLAASFLIGALFAGAMTFAGLRDNDGTDVSSQIVSAHIRGLMSAHSIDVASSDHHTVKPWFNGKLAFAPTVVDLAAQGFPLVGGRVDVVDLEPVATLVYSRGKHLISLTQMPNPRTPAGSTHQNLERGYLALSWDKGNISYWAVSDAAAGDLRNFVTEFQAAAASSNGSR